MKSLEDIEKLIVEIRIKPRSEMCSKVLPDALKVQEELNVQNRAGVSFIAWRTIMKSPITKLTAAAVIIITVVFLITFFEKATAPAYALDQTIEAKNIIKTVHLRMFKNGRSIENNEFSDYWVQYDDMGKLSNLRCNEHGKDGAKFTVWNEGIKKTWIPQDNVVIIKRLNNTAKEWEDFAKAFDYEFLLKWLNDQKEKKEIKLKIIDEPAEDTDFIYVKATHSVDKERLELVVDRKTKLIKKYSEYHIREQGDELGE